MLFEISILQSAGLRSVGKKRPLWVIRVDFDMSAACPIRGAISEMPDIQFAG
jgi:hypothetical protein